MQPLGEAPPGSASGSVTAVNDQGLCTELCRLQLAHLYTAALPVTSKTLQVPKSKSSTLRRRKKEPRSNPGSNEIGAENRLGLPGAGGGSEEGLLNGTKFPFGMMKMFWN